MLSSLSGYQYPDSYEDEEVIKWFDKLMSDYKIKQTKLLRIKQNELGKIFVPLIM